MKKILILLAFLFILEYLQKKSFTKVKIKLLEIYSEEDVLHIEKLNKNSPLLNVLNSSFNKSQNFKKNSHIYLLCYMILGILFVYLGSENFNLLSYIILFFMLCLIIYSSLMEFKKMKIIELLKNESLSIKFHLIFFILYKYITLTIYLLIINTSI